MIYYIDPARTVDGDGTIENPFNAWTKVQIAADNTYLQKAGTTTSVALPIAVAATAAAPIVIGSYGLGAAPVIQGYLDFSGASNVSVSGLSVENRDGAAVVFRNGVNNVTLEGSTFANSLLGVWIATDAGGDNLIKANSVRDNLYGGIAVNQVANAAGHATTIIGNDIAENGAHGIELDGSNFIVENNVVHGNGVSTPGASGIHVFGGLEGQPDGFGNDNTITGNVAYGNRDIWASDGNGIELDQYTHGNTVSDNVAYGNDGAGIIVFDSYQNVIVNNKLWGNELDPSGTHGAKGNLSLFQHLQLTSNNTIYSNTGSDGVAATTFVDPAVTVETAVQAAEVPVYRFFDTVDGTHFFTASVDERNTIIATRQDLVDEGIGLSAVASTDPNAEPVYRFFDTVRGTQFCTASTSERNEIQTSRSDLHYEGIGFYEYVSAGIDRVPVYRFFDSLHGTHFYTADESEQAYTISTRPDLIQEGIAFYSPAER